jgi:hypothetical protein
MRLGVRAAALAVLGMTLVPAAPLRAAPERVHGCMPPAQAREIMIDQKFVAPFRAVAEANRAGNGETVGLQLCQFGEAYVYDVTLLRHDGHVSHTLVDAHSGAVVPGARAGK